MAGTGLRAIAALHHDLGTVEKRLGKHVDRTRVLAGWPYLVVPMEDLPVRPDDEPGWSDSGTPYTLPVSNRWFVEAGETALVVKHNGKPVHTVHLGDVPGDWMTALFARGALVLLVTGTLLEPVTVAAELENLAQDPSNDATLVPLRLAQPVHPQFHDQPSKLAGYLRRWVLPAEGLTNLPAPTPGSVPAGPITLRMLHGMGWFPQALGTMVFDTTKDAHGVYHLQYDCPQMVGTYEQVTQEHHVPFPTVAAAACQMCGPNWDRDLTNVTDYTLTNVIGPAVAAATASRWIATGETDPWHEATNAFNAANRLYQDTLYDRDPVMVAYSGTVLSALHQSIDTVTQTPNVSPGPERALLLTGIPALKSDTERRLDEVAPGFGASAVDLLMKGADPTVFLAQMFPGRDEAFYDRARQFTEKAIAVIDTHINELLGPLVWMCADGAIAPTNPLARLAAWRWGARTHPGAEWTIFAVPVPVADILIRNGVNPPTKEAVVRVGETWDLAQTVATSGDRSFMSQHALQEALEMLRGPGHPWEAMKWREFARAEAALDDRYRKPKPRPSRPVSQRIETLQTAPHATFAGLGKVLTKLKWRVRVTLLVVWAFYGSLLYLLGKYTMWQIAVGLLLLLVVTAAYSIVGSLRSGRAFVKRVEGVHPVTPRTQPDLAEMIEDVAARMGTKVPPCWIIEDRSANAFAFPLGLRKRGIMLHTGWLERATREETMGVVAHELAHVRNGDNLIGAVLNGTIALPIKVASLRGKKSDNYYSKPEHPVLVAIKGVLSFFTLFFALGLIILRASVDRSRETLADLTAAQTLGGPQPMIAGMRRLLKLAEENRGGYAQKDDGALFRTHPASMKRVHTLQETCGQQASWLPVSD